MKKIVALLLLSFSVHAQYTLDWEYSFETSYPDLSTNYWNISDMHKMSDNRIAVIVNAGEQDGGDFWYDTNSPVSGSYICFLRQDGYLLNYYFHSNTIFFVKSPNPTQIIVEEMTSDNLFNKTSDFTIYSSTDNPFVFGTQQIDGLETLSSATDFRDSTIKNISPFVQKDVLYFKDGNLKLLKYVNTNINTVITSHQSAGFNQDNFVLNWNSSSGAQYQIQSSTDLTNWVDVGSALIGTGDMMTWANHVTNSQAFYRVVEE